MSKRKLRRPRNVKLEVGCVDVTPGFYKNDITLVVKGEWREGESGPQVVTLHMQPSDAADIVEQLRHSMEKLLANMKAQLDRALERKS